MNLVYFDHIYMCPLEFLSDPPLPLIQFHVLLPLKKKQKPVEFSLP